MTDITTGVTPDPLNPTTTGTDADAAIQAAYAAANPTTPTEAPQPDYIQAIQASTEVEDPANVATTADVQTQQPATEDLPIADQHQAADPAPTNTPAPDNKEFWDKVTPFTEARQANGGELSDEILNKAAAEFGVPVDVVKQFVESQDAAAKANPTPTETAPTEATPKTSTGPSDVVAQAKAYEAVGGANKWGEFSKWAVDNLTPAEMTAYKSADAATRADLVSVYSTRFKASSAEATPADPNANTKSITNNTVNTARQVAANNLGKVTPFTSAAEQSAAVLDPKYQTDPVYRGQVIARIAATTAQ